MLRSVSASVRRCSKSSFEIASNQEMKGNLKRLLSSPSLTATPAIVQSLLPTLSLQRALGLRGVRRASPGRRCVLAVSRLLDSPSVRLSVSVVPICAR